MHSGARGCVKERSRAKISMLRLMSRVCKICAVGPRSKFICKFACDIHGLRKVLGCCDNKVRNRSGRQASILNWFNIYNQIPLCVGKADESWRPERHGANPFITAVNQEDVNVFFLCLFQDSELLTFNISAHHSWWSEHGPGCVRREMPQAEGVHTTESHSYITVMGCLMDYQYIEVMHSGTQILTAVSISPRIPQSYVTCLPLGQTPPMRQFAECNICEVPDRSGMKWIPQT